MTHTTHHRAGLYVHIPFCQVKCEYCDFYSITQLDQVESFTTALCRELQLRAPAAEGLVFDTVFFGGGTPSLLTEGQLREIWRTLRAHYVIDSHAELTIESNPGTLDVAKLALFREVGFNRLSMGVQSFFPAELRFLGRIHSVEDVHENMANARSAGFENINVDLMTAFPGITERTFVGSLSAAVELQPAHISCYTLIFEPGTGFFKRMQRGELLPIAEEEEAGYYELARVQLGKAGFEQYEISNFAKDGYRCRHNLIYWRHEPYLGFGPSAHSFMGRRRFSNRRSLMAYTSALAEDTLPVDFEETLDDEKMMFEHVFLRLRLREGIDYHEFEQRFGMNFRARFAPVVERLTADGLVESDDRAIRLSARGWMIADTVAACF